MPCGREIRLRRVKSLRRWGIYFISLDAKRQISQFAEQIISPRAKRTISLFVWIKRFEYCTRSVSMGAEAPSEPAGETKSFCPCHEKSTCICKCFFQRNKSLSGFVKCPAGVKYAFGVWNRCGGEGFISFHLMRSIKYHNSRSELFHIEVQRDISLFYKFKS